ncbi:putative permease [Escherichia coli]|nr:putative permease [Escherichia coli]
MVLMTLPRTLVELSPFIALLGGIVGLGQLSKNSELTAIRSTGFSIFRIALVALVAGILWTVSLGAIDEWVASPLQQQALQIKSDCHPRWGRTMTLSAICFGPGAVMNL